MSMWPTHPRAARDTIATADAIPYDGCNDTRTQRIIEGGSIVPRLPLAPSAFSADGSMMTGDASFGSNRSSSPHYAPHTDDVHSSWSVAEEEDDDSATASNMVVDLNELATAIALVDGQPHGVDGDEYRSRVSTSPPATSASVRPILTEFAENPLPTDVPRLHRIIRLLIQTIQKLEATQALRSKRHAAYVNEVLATAAFSTTASGSGSGSGRSSSMHQPSGNNSTVLTPTQDTRASVTTYRPGGLVSSTNGVVCDPLVDIDTVHASSDSNRTANSSSTTPTTITATSIPTGPTCKASTSSCSARKRPYESDPAEDRQTVTTAMYTNNASVVARASAPPGSARASTVGGSGTVPHTRPSPKSNGYPAPFFLAGVKHSALGTSGTFSSPAPLGYPSAHHPPCSNGNHHTSSSSTSTSPSQVRSTGASTSAGGYSTHVPALSLSSSSSALNATPALQQQQQQPQGIIPRVHTTTSSNTATSSGGGPARLSGVASSASHRSAYEPNGRSSGMRAAGPTRPGARTGGAFHMTLNGSSQRIGTQRATTGNTTGSGSARHVSNQAGFSGGVGNSNSNSNSNVGGMGGSGTHYTHFHASSGSAGTVDAPNSHVHAAQTPRDTHTSRSDGMMTDSGRRGGNAPPSSTHAQPPPSSTLLRHLALIRTPPGTHRSHTPRSDSFLSSSRRENGAVNYTRPSARTKHEGVMPGQPRPHKGPRSSFNAFSPPPQPQSSSNSSGGGGATDNLSPQGQQQHGSSSGKEERTSTMVSTRWTLSSHHGINRPIEGISLVAGESSTRGGNGRNSYHPPRTTPSNPVPTVASSSNSSSSAVKGTGSGTTSGGCDLQQYKGSTVGSQSHAAHEPTTQPYSRSHSEPYAGERDSPPNAAPLAVPPSDATTTSGESLQLQHTGTRHDCLPLSLGSVHATYGMFAATLKAAPMTTSVRRAGGKPST